MEGRCGVVGEEAGVEDEVHRGVEEDLVIEEVEEAAVAPVGEVLVLEEAEMPISRDQVEDIEAGVKHPPFRCVQELRRCKRHAGMLNSFPVHTQFTN